MIILLIKMLINSSLYNYLIYLEYEPLYHIPLAVKLTCTDRISKFKGFLKYDILLSVTPNPNVLYVRLRAFPAKFSAGTELVFRSRGVNRHVT